MFLVHTYISFKFFNMKSASLSFFHFLFLFFRNWILPANPYSAGSFSSPPNFKSFPCCAQFCSGKPALQYVLLPSRMICFPDFYVLLKPLKFSFKRRSCITQLHCKRREAQTQQNKTFISLHASSSYRLVYKYKMLFPGFLSKADS